MAFSWEWMARRKSGAGLQALMAVWAEARAEETGRASRGIGGVGGGCEELSVFLGTCQGGQARGLLGNEEDALFPFQTESTTEKCITQ